jgi:hypothetical protein
MLTNRREEENHIIYSEVYHINLYPYLKREVHLETDIGVNISDVNDWQYYISDRQVDEETWAEVLEERRTAIKSSVYN